MLDSGRKESASGDFVVTGKNGGGRIFLVEQPAAAFCAGIKVVFTRNNKPRLGLDIVGLQRSVIAFQALNAGTVFFFAAEEGYTPMTQPNEILGYLVGGAIVVNVNPWSETIRVTGLH